MPKKCQNCGRNIDSGKYCDVACEYEFNRPRTIKGKWAEIQSLVLGLAQLCEQPTTKVGDVLRGLKEYRVCDYCGQLHDQEGRFCSEDCSAANHRDMEEARITGN